MKFLKILVFFLIAFMMCSVVSASDFDDTSLNDNGSISQDSLEINNVKFVDNGDNISYEYNFEKTVFVSESESILSGGVVGYSNGANPSVEIEGDDINNPVNIFVNESFHGIYF